MKRVVFIGSFLVLIITGTYMHSRYQMHEVESKTREVQKPIIALDGTVVDGETIYKTIHHAVAEDEENGKPTDFKIQVLLTETQYTLDLNNEYARSIGVENIIKPDTRCFLEPDQKYVVTVLLRKNDTINAVVVGQLRKGVA